MKLRCGQRLMFALLLFSIIMPSIVLAAAPKPTAMAAVLMDYNTGQILYEKNGDQPLAPASMTKVMTLYLMFDALKAGQVQMDQIVTVSARAAAILESTMWLAEGDRVSFEDLLKGVAVASGNDATVAVAEAVSGSVERFVEQMNEKARALGLTNTHFTNTHGLDEPDHLMSAHDTAVLGYHFIQDHPEALEYTAMSEMTYRGSRDPLRSANTLLGSYEGADGLKTGNTDASIYSILATAKRGDIRLIAVVIGAEFDSVRHSETVALLNYGFGDDFERVVLVQPGDVLEQKLNVRRADKDQVNLEPSEPVEAVIDKGMVGEVETKLDIPEQLNAPVKKGDLVGTLTISYQGQELRTVPVVAAEDSGEANFFKALWQSIVEFFSGLVRFK